MSEIAQNQNSYRLEGENLKVFTFPAPILKQIAKPVTTFDQNLQQLVKDMLFTMYHAPGIGLAAPQVGSSLRLFVMDVDFDREKTLNAEGNTEWKYTNFNPRVFINPVFKQKDGELVYEEGCLSVPGIYENVKRAEHVIVEYQDVHGAKHTIEAEGTLAVCLQHENDHLDGIVFLERLSPLKRQFLTKKFLKAKKG
ncbi:MAG: peptide deformylase [Halobacteriovorax sp.]|nr:peptide deformylase [Halobacteriovorax sp.]